MLIACGGGGGASSETASPSDTSSESSSGNNGPSNSPDSPVLELSWHMPDARENGEDLKAYEINGYRIYYTSSDIAMVQADRIDIGDAQTTDYAFTSLDSGAYRLAIATIDSQGIQSELSEEITASIP